MSWSGIENFGTPRPKYQQRAPSSISTRRVLKIHMLETAIAIEPQNVRLLKDAGTVFRQAGLLLKAEKAFAEAMRWDPSAQEVRKALEDIRAQRAVKGA